MNILIYGAGALGQALGCMLAQAGHQVDLILRPRFVDVLGRDGIQVDGVFGAFSIAGEKLGLFEDIASADKQYHYVLLTTKSYDTADAVAAIASLGERAGCVVSMQNGCGNFEQLQNVFGKQNSLAARVITGFEITVPGRVNITVTADAIHVGGSDGDEGMAQAESFAALIEKAGHPCTAVEDIHQSLYAKLLYNCALNPLGALLGAHYGALAENGETVNIINAIIAETFAVIMALGGRTPWQSARQYQQYFYDTLIPATFNHRASMLQDLESGKRTEINALTGYVSEHGKSFGVPTPFCDCVTAMVRFREARIVGVSAPNSDI